MPNAYIIVADVLNGLASLPDESVQCCITSPPYWGLRRYLPGKVVLKKDAPEWVLEKLKELGIAPTSG